MDMMEQLLLLLVSLVANGFSALAGGGAGLLQFPALLWLGLPFAIALATHKVASVALGLGASIRYLRSGIVGFRFSLFVLAAGLPGVYFGALVVLSMSEQLLLIALGFLTVAMGVYSWCNPSLGMTRRNYHASYWHYFVGGCVLFIIGFLNGSLTSGTGLFVTLWLVRWFGLDYKQAVAYTLVLVGVFWNGIGGLTLAIVGQVAWDWLPALLIGSLVGGYVGAHWAILKGNSWIKRAFEWITIFTGFSLIWRAFAGTLF